MVKTDSSLPVGVSLGDSKAMYFLCGASQLSHDKAALTQHRGCGGDVWATQEQTTIEESHCYPTQGIEAAEGAHWGGLRGIWLQAVTEHSAVVHRAGAGKVRL